MVGTRAGGDPTSIAWMLKREDSKVSQAVQVNRRYRFATTTTWAAIGKLTSPF
jgi:hypothetical protein